MKQGQYRLVGRTVNIAFESNCVCRGVALLFPDDVIAVDDGGGLKISTAIMRVRHAVGLIQRNAQRTPLDKCHLR